MIQLRIGVLDPELVPPARAYESDAGIDLRARIDATLTSVVAPVRVPTGVAVEVPVGYVGLVCSRSGLAAERGIAVLNAPGVVDPGYRGELFVVLFSTVEQAYVVRRGDRIAQLLVVPAPTIELVFVDELAATPRGVRGLGSSGA
jgi:dUTP pyrophosphatase